MSTSARSDLAEEHISDVEASGGALGRDLPGAAVAPEGAVHLRILESAPEGGGALPSLTEPEPLRPSGTFAREALFDLRTPRKVMRVTFPEPRVRRRVVQAMQSVLQLSGAAAAFVRACEIEGAMILVYHAVVTGEEARWLDPRYTVSVGAFESQMRFLARYRKVVSVGTLMDSIERGRSIPPGTVAITFDDGYLTTLTRAVPILKRYGLPALTYVATGYVSRQEPQFADVLFSAFNFRTRHELDFPPDILGRARLTEREPIRWAYMALEHALLSASYEDRRILLAEIVDQLRPGCLPPRLTLSWSDVARMRELHEGMEIGLHTRDHVDLSSCSAERAASEITACIDDARAHLDGPIHHFSYPFGRSHAAARAAVARAGLRSGAVTEPPALVRNGVDRFALPRLNAPKDMSRFPFFTGGAYPDLSLAVLRRT
jgi:peptidoglycan/xylan/chitin deacetylase (PgdA/CDA1 family)